MRLLIFLLLVDIILLIITGVMVILNHFSRKSRTDKCSTPEKPDLIITSSETLEVVSSCIESFLHSYVDKIIVALDHPSDSLVKGLSLRFGNRINIVINKEKRGKIYTQSVGIKSSTNEYILLVDADIKLLGDIKDMCMFMHTKALDFACPYSVGEEKGFWPHISDVDRMMRQRIIRTARDFAGLSNLTGYFLLCKRTSYLNVIDPEAIQDDVVSTIKLQKLHLKVGTYGKVMCSEIERPNFKGLLFQKVRWTAGNLSLLPDYLKLVDIGILKATFFFCSFLLWYYVYYVDFAVTVFVLLNPCRQLVFLLIAEYVLRGIAIKISSPCTRIFYICMYLLLWPVLMTFALILVPMYRILKLEQLSRR